MADERWQRAKDIAQRALELDDSARAAYLKETCGSDRKLHELVEIFVGSGDDHPTFLEPLGSIKPVLDWWLSPSLDPRGDSDPLIGLTIDHYLIRRRLGQGGMATVYEAWEDNVGRSVAFKVIRDSLNRDDVKERFDAERRHLAQMDPSNVAALYRAGTIPDGRPYFAMEYVPGLPVTRFCDEQRLSLRERLAIFAKICRAVHHAHEKKVIHRDLKPSNILVYRASGELRIKVIDFGIAKALTTDSAAIATGSRTLPVAVKAAETQPGVFIGTPEYASPEQIPKAGLPISARSDVYSLSVVLYELLCGLLPLDLAGLDSHASFDKILNENPRPPAKRLESVDEARQAEIARQRATTVEALTRVLRSRLEQIVLKGLAKEPRNRYESAAELADEIERYLKAWRGRGMQITVGIFLLAVLATSATWFTSPGPSGVIPPPSPTAPPPPNVIPPPVESAEARLHVCWQSVENAILRVDWQDLAAERPVSVLMADRNNLYTPQSIFGSSGSIDLAPGSGLVRIVFARRCPDPESRNCQKPVDSEAFFEPFLSHPIPPRDEKEACQ